VTHIPSQAESAEPISAPLVWAKTALLNKACVCVCVCVCTHGYRCICIYYCVLVVCLHIVWYRGTIWGNMVSSLRCRQANVRTQVHTSRLRGVS